MDIPPQLLLKPPPRPILRGRADFAPPHSPSAAVPAAPHRRQCAAAGGTYAILCAIFKAWSAALASGLGSPC